MNSEIANAGVEGITLTEVSEPEVSTELIARNIFSCCDKVTVSPVIDLLFPMDEVQVSIKLYEHVRHPSSILKLDSAKNEGLGACAQTRVRRRIFLVFP